MDTEFAEAYALPAPAYAYSHADAGEHERRFTRRAASGEARRVDFRTISYYSTQTEARRESGRSTGLALAPRVTYDDDTVTCYEPMPTPDRRTRVSADTVILTDSPAATVGERVAAVVLDSVFTLAALALYTGILALASVPLLDAAVRPYHLGALALVALTYRLFWALLDADTPGLRCLGLYTVDFEGRRPTRHQRLRRVLGGGLSVAGAALGLIWALLDEEKLTWHDHFSHSFPTSVRPD